MIEHATLGWQIFTRSDVPERHVTPVDDLMDHDKDRVCECRPVQDIEDPGRWMHNSIDGRERHERGAPLH